MIKVTIKETDSIKEIEIKGHANYSKYGSDIVCASVSSMCITTVNAIIKIDDSAIDYKEDEGYLLISIKKHSDTVDKLIINLVDLLEELKNDYQKYIEIRRCHL